jgi:hypothetical protein
MQNNSNHTLSQLFDITTLKTLRPTLRGARRAGSGACSEYHNTDAHLFDHASRRSGTRLTLALGAGGLTALLCSIGWGLERASETAVSSSGSCREGTSRPRGRPRPWERNRCFQPRQLSWRYSPALIFSSHTAILGTGNGSFTSVHQRPSVEPKAKQAGYNAYENRSGRRRK